MSRQVRPQSYASESPLPAPRRSCPCRKGVEPFGPHRGSRGVVRVLLVVIFACLAGSAWAEKRVALVLAADEYKILRPLENAVNDGRAVETALEKLGFEVFSETNRDLRRMRRALDDFREDGAGADVALVFFSGHGVEINGENRLLPVDADPASLERLKETSLPLEEVTEAVAAIGRIGLIVLDACRNDPFGGQPGAEDGSGRGAVSLKPEVAAAVKPGLGRMGRAENILFSFSAAPGQTASDGAAGNSEFSAALAKFLPTEGLEIRSVLTLVQQEVYDVSRGRQLPYVESGLPKLFFAAASSSALPERDRLLLAMADITPDLRSEVEKVAASADMPLAPLYAALITSGGPTMQEGERRTKLTEAAQSFVQVRADMRKFASSDPRVAELRGQAEAQLALGAFGEARILLTKAAAIDEESRVDLKQHYIDRTISEAETHYLAGGAARAALNYVLAIEDFGKAASLYDEVAGFDIPDDARYRHTLSLELVGTMQMTVGNLAAAATAYEAMARAAEKRAAAQPDVVARQRDVVVARDKIAEVRLAEGDIAGAIAMFEESRATLKDIIDKEPEFEYVRDLAYSYNQTGDARRISGDVAGAEQDYRVGLKISAFLVENVPDYAGYRRDLGVSHSKLGLALRMGNDLEAARTEYEAALAISRDLSAKSPDDMELQRDITVSLNAMGDISRLTGDNASAQDFYRQSVEISRKLVARDPGNTLWRRDLGLGISKLADTRQAAGDSRGALTDYQSALALAQYLAELDPANAEWQRDLSFSQNRVGDALLATGDAKGAADAYQAGYAVAAALLAADPDNVTRILDAAYSRYKLGIAGLDPVANLEAARDMLGKLKADGRLPGANESWATMVETALKRAKGG